MREVDLTLIAGQDVTIPDVLTNSDGSVFDGSLYEVIGNGRDIADLETVALTFGGTIDSVGAFALTATAADTDELGGKVIAFDAWVKSGPFEEPVMKGYLRFTERMTS